MEKKNKMSSDKAKTQKISHDRKKTVTLTSVLTKFFQSGKTSVFPIYGDEKEQGNQDDEFLKNIETSESMQNVHQEFEFKKEIAVGGQGTIHTAIDKNFQRVVAIKSLNEDLKGKDSARKTFLREAALTAQLEHPSIVPIHGIFNDGENGLHIAMKLIKGKTLKTYLKVLSSQYRIMKKKEIRQSENFLFSQKLELFLRICSAVSFMHRKNIIHRDLKPENIMIGDFNETYIMDLGIAVHKEPENRDAVPAGTPQYIAPEVVSGEMYDHRSDIYLLGLILYELICLRQAYPQKELEEVIAYARAGIIQPVKHAFGADISREMKYIIRKATRRNPEERYQSVIELADDIRAHIALQTVKANPHKILAYLRNFLIRRYRLLIGLVLAAFLLFFAALGYIYHQNAIEAEKRNQATQITSKVMSEGVRKAAALNDEIRRYEMQLCQITEEAGVRLSGGLPPTRKTGTFHTPGNPPEKLEFSRTYGTKVNMDHMIWIFPGKSDTEKSDAGKLSPMQNSFFRAICDSRGYRTYISENEIKYQLLHQKCAPFQNIYLGLSSGLYVSYPYTKFAPDYDPRTRPWYNSAVATEGKRPVWTKPYLDASTNEIVITCSSKILAPENGKFKGVCAVDITVNSLAETLQKNLKIDPNRFGVYLLDYDGIIVLDLNTGKHDKNKLDRQFPHKNAFRYFLSSDCGQFVTNENGREILYFFMKIPSLNWIYVERFHYDALMQKTFF